MCDTTILSSQSRFYGLCYHLLSVILLRFVYIFSSFEWLIYLGILLVLYTALRNIHLYDGNQHFCGRTLGTAHSNHHGNDHLHSAVTLSHIWLEVKQAWAGLGHTATIVAWGSWVAKALHFLIMLRTPGMTLYKVRLYWHQANQSIFFIPSLVDPTVSQLLIHFYTWAFHYIYIASLS